MVRGGKEGRGGEGEVKGVERNEKKKSKEREEAAISQGGGWGGGRGKEGGRFWNQKRVVKSQGGKG